MGHSDDLVSQQHPHPPPFVWSPGLSWVEVRTALSGTCFIRHTASIVATELSIPRDGLIHVLSPRLL